MGAELIWPFFPLITVQDTPCIVIHTWAADDQSTIPFHRSNRLFAMHQRNASRKVHTKCNEPSSNGILRTRMYVQYVNVEWRVRAPMKRVAIGSQHIIITGRGVESSANDEWMNLTGADWFALMNGRLVILWAIGSNWLLVLSSDMFYDITQ